jgi:hypothetical protein
MKDEQQKGILDIPSDEKQKIEETRKGEIQTGAFLTFGKGSSQNHIDSNNNQMQKECIWISMTLALVLKAQQ